MKKIFSIIIFIFALTGCGSDSSSNNDNYQYINQSIESINSGILTNKNKMIVNEELFQNTINNSIMKFKTVDEQLLYSKILNDNYNLIYANYKYDLKKEQELNLDEKTYNKNQLPPLLDNLKINNKDKIISIEENKNNNQNIIKVVYNYSERDNKIKDQTEVEYYEKIYTFENDIFKKLVINQKGKLLMGDNKEEYNSVMEFEISNINEDIELSFD